MNYKITERGAEITMDSCFDLKNTFECGQCFRWNENPDGSYSGIAGDRRATISRCDDRIIIKSCTDADDQTFWHSYLDLDTPYDTIRQELMSLSPQLRCAAACTDGIRILRQDPWEALCSFIISQNNNIPRIKGIISRLCEEFGEPCGDSERWYSFPPAERLAGLSPDDLAPLRAGFRARYLCDAAYKVASGTVCLEKLYAAPLDEARAELMKIVGVGTKVAECTLLYGFHRLEAFPVDVWMKKALATMFNGITPSELGQYAGVAQQYIFHYSRLHPEQVSGI